ncbi:MAG: protein translocase subunit SecD [Anaerolineae bacterium]
MERRNLYWLGFIIILAVVAIWIDLPGEHPAWFQRLLVWRPPEAREIKIQQGLDLQGGLQVVLQAAMPEGQTVDSDSMQAAEVIIRNRVDSLGVAEPLVQRAGGDKIVVELPGISNPEQAIRTFGQTGLLEFIDAGFTPLFPGQKVKTTYPVLKSELAPTPEATAAITPTTTVTATAAFTPTETATLAPSPTATVVPTATVTTTAAISPTATAPTPTATVTPTEKVYETVITGRHLRTAVVGFDRTTGKPVVNFALKPEGAKLFYDYTSTHIGQYLAIALDKEIISSPVVRDAIRDQGTISGDFTLQEARSLVIQLKYGALPVPLKVVENRTVGPTLGQDSVQRSITAGIIGFAIVLFVMLSYYRLPGFLADLALCLYVLMNFALFKLIPVTLTLPGIAGFILSVGMAVDANILIFERMKEELRWGRSLAMAIDAGFDRAWTSIRDSNISTLITCVILFLFGSGVRVLGIELTGAPIVKGFAVTLFIGVVTSMFTAITVTRTFLRFVFSLGGAMLQEKRWLLGV